MTEGERVTRPQSSPYRADIDGLRAVAILAVVGFHAFPGRIQGGFVGVDLFFVISGFLISTIILGGLERKTFRFREFYSRRVRRIFPALIVVLTAVAVAGWIVMLPKEYEQLGKHISGGGGFVSNLILWSEAGYFDLSAAKKPLLHLWSLGVEEQFYLIWPALLYVTWKWARKGFLPILLILFVGSLGLNLWLIGEHTVATFYNPATRFWEFLLGGILSYLTLQGALRIDGSSKWSEVGSILGILAIAISVVGFDREAPFPGWRAILPAFGAFLVIASGSGTWLNRTFLRHPVMVWFGLISYPLYLVHWPLLTFIRVVEGAVPSAVVRMLLIGISVFVSWLIFKFVEKPIRFGKAIRYVVPGLITSVAFLCVLGASILFTNGYAAARGPWDVLNIADSYNAASDRYTASYVIANSAYFLPKFKPEIDFCHITRKSSPEVEIVVLGDSHANRLYHGLTETTDYTMADLGRGNALPLVGYEVSLPGKRDVLGLSPTMERLVDRVIEISPRVVILTGMWALAYDGRLTVRSEETMAAMMRRTFVRLASHVPRVIVVYDVPELPFDPSHWMERPFERNREDGPDRYTFSRAGYDASRLLYQKDLESAARGIANVVLFDPASVFCDAGNCYVVKQNQLLYDDRNHLSRYGATLLARAMMPLIVSSSTGG